MDIFFTNRPSAISMDWSLPWSCESPSMSIPLSFLTCSEETGLKSLVSTKVMIGFGCFETSNGMPGGGVCATAAPALTSVAVIKRRKVSGRNIANIIIEGVKATVRSIFIKKDKGRGAVSLDAVEAVGGGLTGDHHTGLSRQRQILLVSGTVLDELNLEPGSISENVVIDGIDVMCLQEGQSLRLGEGLVTVRVPYEPSINMERGRKGLQAELENSRGMFVRVVEDGTVRVGDGVEIVQETARQSR